MKEISIGHIYKLVLPNEVIFLKPMTGSWTELLEHAPAQRVMETEREAEEEPWP